MAHSFSEIVDDYLQDIAYVLRHPEALVVSELASTPVPDSRYPLTPARDRAGTMMPVAHVDHLVGGSHILTDDATDPQAYFVFARQSSHAPFAYRATLYAEVDIPRFVENAYLTVLERQADEAGRGNYVMMLREGYLRPTELLKTLASSDEFLNRTTRIVIVPQTSQWFQALAMSPETVEITTAMDL